MKSRRMLQSLKFDALFLFASLLIFLYGQGLRRPARFSK